MRAIARHLYRGQHGEIPVVLCIDIEPDDRAVDRRNPDRWRGFEQFAPRVETLRERLRRATGAPVAFTWLVRMDPQVADTWGSPTWAVETYRYAFSQLEARGDEIGLHTHLWRWDRDAAEWTTDHDPGWSGHCLSTGLDAFERAFGRPCTGHRGGDAALNGEMLGRLAARGVKVDLSVAPGVGRDEHAVDGERRDGTAPDYSGAPSLPYRSSPESFPAPDPVKPSDPLLVPLLTGRALRGIWPAPISPGAHRSVFALRLLGELRRARARVLAFETRTDPACLRVWKTLAGNLEHVGRHPGARFVTATAAAEPFLERR